MERLTLFDGNKNVDLSFGKYKQRENYENKQKATRNSFVGLIPRVNEESILNPSFSLPPRCLPFWTIDFGSLP